MSISSPTNDFPYGELMKLANGRGKFREDKAVLGIMPRIKWFFVDLFKGGSKKQNIAVFNKLQSSLVGRVTDLKMQLEDKDSDDNNIQLLGEVKKVMQIEAKIFTSGWAKSLKGGENYQTFKKEVGGLQNLAKTKCEDPLPDSENLPETAEAWKDYFTEDRKLAQWIHSDPLQRKFAVWNDSEDLPLRGREIPRGAVLLANPTADLIGYRLLGQKASALGRKWRKDKIIKPILSLFTKSPKTHAVLSLGEGQFFHMDKGPAKNKAGDIEKRSPGGYVEERTWKDRALYLYHVHLPNKTMLDELERKNLKDSFFDKIVKGAKTEGTKKKTYPLDLIRVILPTSRRPKGYTEEAAEKEWVNSKQGFSCSGAIGALYANKGFDVGKQFGKRPNRITPGDLYKSKYFDSIYSPTPGGK
ncbi:MAG: hypothetical protein K940chlam7_01344 [Chlamydiae bacterium]|nr:hypothetical protein [Chlamydiota bacterium]